MILANLRTKIPRYARSLNPKYAETTRKYAELPPTGIPKEDFPHEVVIF